MLYSFFMNANGRELFANCQLTAVLIKLKQVTVTYREKYFFQFADNLWGFPFNSNQYIFVNVNDANKIGTTEGDDPPSALGGLPTCRKLIIGY